MISYVQWSMQMVALKHVNKKIGYDKILKKTICSLIKCLPGYILMNTSILKYISL